MVIFSEACVKNSVHGGEGCAWQGVCMAGGHAWQGACMAGGRAWQILRDTVNELAVCILLEMHSCLVYSFSYI